MGPIKISILPDMDFSWPKRTFEGLLKLSKQSAMMLEATEIT